MSRFRSLFAALLLVAATLAAPAFAQTASYSAFANFTNNSAGSEPYGNLIQGPDGNFYGEDFVISNDVSTLDGVVYKMSSTGALTAFYSPGSASFAPSGLIVGSDGYLYGENDTAGANGYGFVFKISPSGTMTDLYDFKDSTDGGYPTGNLLQGSDGNYYGVTTQGGDLSACVSEFTGEPEGCGTIYKLAAGKFSVVYTFQGTTADYSYPVGGLVQGLDGNYYGVTLETVFQLTPAYKLTTIGVTNGTTDGLYFYGPLVEGSDGAFYGTSEYNGSAAYGTVFKATVAGGISLVDALCTASPCPEGGTPYAPLFEAGDGNFYGTTFAGNNGDCETFGCGGFFQVNTAGKLTALYSASDASSSSLNLGVLYTGTVVQGSDGAIYGPVGHGGTGADLSECGGDNCGIIFRAVISPTAAPPVVLKASSSTVTPNTAVTLSYTVNAANSLTSQQCYAFVQGSTSGAGTWTGKQTGTYSSSTHAWTGSASVTPTADGTYTYALTCGGTVSGFATITVAAAKTSTSTVVTATPNPASVGQSVSVKATVSSSSGTPTGLVSFSAYGTAIGSSMLSSGVATLSASTNGLPTGTYPVIATYGGSTTYNASTSAAYNVTLNVAPTTTTLTASPNPATPPATVTLTATVKRSASGATGTPTGSVTFSSGTTTLGTAKLNASGVATYAASSSGLPAGSYPVTAKYTGDASDADSTSATTTVTLK
jgi:uncharacterized repeat protein (TIGR03803 family)